MKELDTLDIPDDRFYSEDHEWARKEGDTIRIGITDYAQDHLGAIAYVEFPAVGERFDKDSEFGVVESIKSVSDLQTPVAGEVVRINTALAESPDLVNSDPNSEGWLIEIKPDSVNALDGLMNAIEYRAMLMEE